MRIVIALMLLCLTGCAQMRAGSEAYYYSYSKKIILENVADTVLKECYEVQRLRPPTFVYAKHPKNLRGWYKVKEGHVFYTKGNMPVLIHEYQHFFNYNGLDGEKVSWDCLDQVSAFYAQRIYALERDNKRLKESLRR